MARIVFLLNSTASHLWRVTPQMKHFHEQGHECMSVHVDKFTDKEATKIVNWCDIFVFQMVADPSLVSKIKKLGKKTVFECDDVLDTINKNHPMRDTIKWNRSGLWWRWIFFNMIARVDVMTVTNDLLAKRYKWLRPRKPIYVIPNYMDIMFWDRFTTPHKAKYVKIGWAGGLSHHEDLEYIAPVMKKIIHLNPETRFMTVGDGGYTGSKKIISMEYGKDHFPEIPASRREYSPGARPETWPSKLASFNFDIAIAPLLDTPFSRHKTPIKYFEYGINKIPGVYQGFMYGQVVKHGITGFLANTYEEWEKYITMLVKDKKLRDKIGKAAYEDVRRNYNLHDHWEEWDEAYGTLYPKNNSSQTSSAKRKAKRTSRKSK